MKRVVAVIAVVGLILVGTLSWSLGTTTPGGPAVSTAATPSDGPATASASASHAVPALEALLPDSIDGVPLVKDSATGGTVLGASAWGAAMRTFLAGQGRQPADLRFAQAHDPSGSLDAVLVAVQVPGVPAARVAEAIVAGSRSDYPSLKASQLMIGGKPTTRVVYGDGGSDTFLYVHADVVYDVETSTPGVAAAAMTILP